MVGRLVALGEHAVAARGEQPRDREVGRVVARAEPPGRDERAHDRPVLRLVGAVGDDRLDRAPAHLHGDRPLAEPEKALARAGAEAHPDRLDVPGSGDRRRGQPQVAVAGGRDPDAQPAHRVGRGDLGLDGAARALQADGARRVLPRAARSDGEGPRGRRPWRAGLLLEHGASRPIHEAHVPGLRLDDRRQRAGVDLEGAHGARIRALGRRLEQQAGGDHRDREREDPARDATDSTPRVSGRRHGAGRATGAQG